MFLGLIYIGPPPETGALYIGGGPLGVVPPPGVSGTAGIVPGPTGEIGGLTIGISSQLAFDESGLDRGGH